MECRATCLLFLQDDGQGNGGGGTIGMDMRAQGDEEEWDGWKDKV